METWASREVQTVHLGDARLDARLVLLLEDLFRRPSSSIPKACESWGKTQATYRFFANPSVTPEKILAAHRAACVERMRSCSVVLCVQDSTEVCQTSHRATRGLGHLAGPGQQGFTAHSSIALSENGVPLGTLDQRCWSRDPAKRGQSKDRRSRPLAEKESQRWIDALAACEQIVPRDLPMVTITDREGDIFGLFATPRRAGSELLVRVAHDRCVTDGRHVVDAIAAAPALGMHHVEVHARHDRPARTAALTVRVGTYDLRPPLRPSPGSHFAPVRVTMILAQEEQAPDRQAPIRWMLLTTCAVRTLADAVRCLRWYTYRWVIERFHYTLKSGCQIEQLQLQTAQALYRAVAVYSIIAWRILWMMYHARHAPEAPCERIVQPHEWRTLYCAVHRTTALPAQAPTVRQVVRWIAQLGGFLGRKGDGEPGVKVLWRGLQSLDLAAEVYSIISNEHSTESCV